jgi:hypothetical protein
MALNIMDFDCTRPFKDDLSFTEGKDAHLPVNPAIHDRLFDAPVLQSTITANKGEYRWIISRLERGVRSFSAPNYSPNPLRSTFC